jgi:hypothetical protein
MSTKSSTVSGLSSANRLAKPDIKDVGVQSIVFRIELGKAEEKSVSPPVAADATHLGLEQVDLAKSPSIEVMNESFVKLGFEFYNK